MTDSAAGDAAAADPHYVSDSELDEELIGNEADRLYLESLPMVQRENVLAERYERRKKLQERDALLRGSAKAAASAAVAVSVTPSRKLRDRARVADTHKAAALSEIRRKRGKAASDDESSSSEEGELSTTSSEEEEEEEEDDEAGARKRRRQPSAVAAAAAAVVPMISDVAFAQKVQLRRQELEALANKPWVADAVHGFFARVQVGRHSGKPVYRMVGIASAKEGTKPYTLSSGHQTFTVLALHYPGAPERDMRITFISNSPIEEQELLKFSTDAKTHHDESWLRISTQDVEAMRKRFNTLASRPHTEEDVKEMVEKRSKHRVKPVNLTSALFDVRAKIKTLMDRLVYDPTARAELEESKKLLQELLAQEEQESEMTARAEESSFRRPVEIGKINKRSRERNYEVQRMLTRTVTQADAKGDVFARIQTAPTMCLPPSKKLTKEEIAEAERKKKEEEKAAKQKKLEQEQQRQLQQQKEKPKPRRPEDSLERLRALHDFDVDIDLAGITAGRITIADSQEEPSLPATEEAAFAMQLPVCPELASVTKCISFAEYLQQRQQEQQEPQPMSI